MSPRARPEHAVLALVLAFATGAWADPAEPPRGRRSPHKAPPPVVLRAVDLDAQGALARLVPGVPVVAGAARAAGPVAVTLAGPVELTGRVDGTALGARVAADTELRGAAGGAAIGKPRAGA